MKRWPAASLLSLACLAAGSPTGSAVAQGGSVGPAMRLDRVAVFDGTGTDDAAGATHIGPAASCSCGERSPLDRVLAPLSTEEDEDGPINTDRPSFTPSNAVVPRGRLQVESGYTFSHDLTRTTRTDEHLFPELAVRLGLNEWLELRTFWGGQTYSRTTERFGDRVVSRSDGPTNFVAGFKWQLSDQERWVPKVALITDLAIPTSGSSPNSSDGIDPVVFLLYGWELTDRFTLAGSTGLTTVFDRGVADATVNDAFEQYSQSLIGSFSAADKVTLFYEWFVLARTNSALKLPQHFMDGGLLYQPTPNIQLDLRAGFGLGDHPTDFFAGAGVSFRY